MVLRENMMTFPTDMNSAVAARRGFPYAMSTANFQYHAEMNANGEEHNLCLLSGCNPVQHQLSVNNNLNSTMVEVVPNPVRYNNQAPPQAFPAAYPSTIRWQEQQFPNIYNPARAFVPLPALANVTHNATMASINNYVDSLMPSNGNLDDTIDFEQLLVGFRIVHPGPRNVHAPVSNALTVTGPPAPIPTRGHNQIMQTQVQQILPQTHGLCSENHISKNGVIQMAKRRRIYSPEEDMDRKMRQMIKNRASAARSRARKLAREIELQTEVSKLREENEYLKNMMQEATTETKDNNKNLRRTKSWC